MDPFSQNRGSGLTRYRSAPSSFFDNIIDGSNYHGDFSNRDLSVNDDCRFFRSPSPEMESLFGKSLSPNNEEKSVKQEANMCVSQRNAYENDSEMVHRNLDVQSFGTGVSGMDSRLFGVTDNLIMNDSIQSKAGPNLPRQNSSPAEFLSQLGSENGLNSHMNLSYGVGATNSRQMPQIAEDRTESNSVFSENSWNKSSFTVLKGAGVHDITFSSLESQNGNSNNRLAHHTSLPTNFSERATTEKFLHFQSTVPFKTRAKRGCATHPRSIAERVRRTRISDRMRKLQDLFPDMDKHTNTSDMLEMAVAQIKELQKQVKALSDTRARCTCANT